MLRIPASALMPLVDTMLTKVVFVTRQMTNFHTLKFYINFLPFL